MKELFMQGILSNQEGQDTLEWTAIAALIVLVAIAVIAIVGNYVKERAAQIVW
jgi:Flp pilus assembly pilin Flp